MPKVDKAVSKGRQEDEVLCEDADSDSDSEVTTSEPKTGPNQSVTLSPKASLLPIRPGQTAVSAQAKPSPRCDWPAFPPQPVPKGLNEKAVLTTYWKERTKLIKHLEKRAEKFEKKSKIEYDRARWGKEPAKQDKKDKKDKKAKTPSVQPSPSIPPTPPSQSPSQSVDSMNVVKRAATEVNGATKVASSSRSFSTSAPLASMSKSRMRKRELDKQKVDSEEAIRILRSMEIAYPHTAYNLRIKVGAKSGHFPSIRGRAMLPHDPRRNRDIILVFAHPDSADARLATEAGVDHVGNESLFEPLQNGEIKPTKILCVPSLLPSVTAKLGRFLGQRGLMPTARRGGVGEGEELVQRIREARGMTDWMTDNKGGIIALCGRLHHTPEQVAANIRAITGSIRRSFPSAGATAPEDSLVSRTKKKKEKAPAWIDTLFVQSSQSNWIPLRETQ